MDISLPVVLPNEMIDRLSEELTGIDLFHFTLVTEYSLNISNYYVIKLFHSRPNLLLNKEIHSLIAMRKSPYSIEQNGISVVLSSNKWNNFVYGLFTLEIIEKSLKYYSTSIFFLYCQLWSFNPFYYNSSYPILDIFQYSYLLQRRQLSEEESTLFKSWGNNQSAPLIVTSVDKFIENLTNRYEYDIWGSCVDWDLFIIAGGSILLSLFVQPLAANASDIDLFFLKEHPHLFKDAVNKLESRLQHKYFVRRKTIWLNRLVQFDLFRKVTINDIFNGKTLNPSITIQLIRPTMFPVTISRILHSFDLDICGACFNSKRVFISFACLQALNTGYTTCYAMPLTPSQMMRRVPRLHKYQQRGFNILCPQQFDIDAFLATPIENCSESQPERAYRFRRRHFGDNCDSFSIQKQFCNHYNIELNL